VGVEGNRRTADVRVKGFTNLFILSKADFESAMSEFPAAHKMLKKRARYVLFIIYHSLDNKLIYNQAYLLFYCF